jgi:cullin-4
MKTRRTTTHASLVAETFAQISFPAKPVDVKKRIESLIEREYLERDRNDPQTYNYLA